MCPDKIIENVLILSLTAGLLSACGGGGSNTPVNRAPQIQGLQDQSLPQDTATAPLPFQVSDADSPVADVMVSVESSDSSVIAADGIALGGSGASRTIQLTPVPEAVGNATILVRATDPVGLTSLQTFRVQVNGVFVSFRSTTNQTFAVDENDAPLSLTGITVTADADDDPVAFDALLE